MQTNYIGVKWVIFGLLSLGLPLLEATAQGRPPEDWRTDPELVRVNRLPQPRNLREAYADFKPSVKGAGVVSFKVMVGPDGKVVQHELIAEASTLENADPAIGEFEALLKQLTFEAALSGGRPTTARTAVSFAYPTPSTETPEPALEEVMELDRAPAPINHADVAQRIGYPSAAQAAGQRGRLVLSVLVDESGRYIKHVLKRTAGRLLLDAVEAEISQVSYAPAVKGRRTVKAWVDVAFDFPVQRGH